MTPEDKQREHDNLEAYYKNCKAFFNKPTWSELEKNWGEVKKDRNLQQQLVDALNRIDPRCATKGRHRIKYEGLKARLNALGLI